MTGAYLFLFIALGVFAINIVCSILIIRELIIRKVKINFLLLRFLLPKYVHDYKKMTLEETGKVGILFPLWIISINTTLVLAVIGAILSL